jgi:hypothetical protein
MTSLSDSLPPRKPSDIASEADPKTAQEAAKPDVSTTEIPDAVSRAPWLFQKGNTYGKFQRKYRRQRIEHHIQRLTLGGETLVEFWVRLFAGEPFWIREVEKLNRTPEQEATARGEATPDQKKKAKKQRRFVVVKRLYYPTVEDMKEANNWLSERGFGKAPQIVQIEENEGSGFKLVYRRWPVGVDPLAEGPPPGERVIDGKAKALPPHRGNGNPGSNGHS